MVPADTGRCVQLAYVHYSPKRDYARSATFRDFPLTPLRLSYPRFISSQLTTSFVPAPGSVPAVPAVPSPGSQPG
jgi:hypothetical protein